MLSEPDLAYLEVNTSLTQKIRFLRKLFLRIKSQIGDRVDKKEWRVIDSNIEVIYFKHLSVSKYIILDDQICRPLDETNIDCYIEIDNKVLRKLYIKNLENSILFSISSELIKEIHPNIELSLTSLVLNMLEKDSYKEMDDYLTSIGYPDVDETKGATLRSNKQIEDYSFSNSNQDLDVEEYNYDVHISNESESILINEEQSYVIANNAVPKNEHEHSVDNMVPFNTDSQLSKSSIFQNAGTTNNKHFNENDVNEDLNSPITAGRTTSPTKNMDFKKAIEEEYAPRNYPENHEEFSIDKNLEPMSLEDEKRFNDAVNSEIESEIGDIREENAKRTYRYRLERIKDKPSSKLEVKEFYDGKCQICDYTFREKTGRNHCITISLLKQSKGGIRHPANYLCLCPNHSALIKHADIRGLDKESLVNLKDNKISFSDGTREHEIKYDSIHFKMLKQMLKRGNH